MRSRILKVALMASVLAVLVTGIPACFAVAKLVSSAERTELQGLALTAAARVGPAFRGGDPVELPTTESDVQLGVYAPDGHLAQGTGPSSLNAEQARRATGGPMSDTVAGQIVEYVPIHDGEQVIGAVRASSSTSGVRTSTLAWWLAIGAGALVALLCAGLYAARQSQRLSGPIDDLTGSVVALGDGVFTLDDLEASGVPEIDKAASSLRRTARRLADMIDRERSFTAGASHQLRTPLTQLQLSLESGLSGSQRDLRQAAQEALDTAEVLSETIDDVLALGRISTAEDAHANPATVVDRLAPPWRVALASQGRRLRIQIEETTHVAVSEAVLRQTVNTLVDNAVKHGSGTVTVSTRSAFDAVAVDIADEGTGPPIDPRADASLGLQMAVTIIERAGGRVIADRTGVTLFTLLLPAVQDPPPST